MLFGTVLILWSRRDCNANSIALIINTNKMYYHLSRKRNSAKNILYENVKIIGLFFFPTCKWWFVNDFTKLFKNDIARWGGREEPIISEKVDNGGGGWRGRRLLLRPKLFEVRGSITPVSLSCDPWRYQQ